MTFTTIHWKSLCNIFSLICDLRRLSIRTRSRTRFMNIPAALPKFYMSLNKKVCFISS